ncbi:unnamed protein product [Didymodactylos carnosus]|uniref:carnitine O-palmitoyltransferase n=1 Tax=Didymodactylos carnosus TaxID=1234261 RepID=A0A814W917_9BILA|nr:unnamed protein product [Didymodactylos carnosus]CAF1198940.1 unnamed protein product [Didymodactylos carnosus]CAF3672892.1 unnamed protein product [Didymodactylos carnosus]CAF3963573.1 unnamed protein product [Didymodactylos carnosus]
MAEAHEAVAFSFQIGPDGVNVDLSYDALKAVIYSGLRSWRLRLRRGLNSLYNSLYPGGPIRGTAFCGAITILYHYGYDTSFSIIPWLEQHVFERYFVPKTSKYLACIAFGCGVYVILVETRVQTLKTLFSYHGWMYQTHGQNASILPRVWTGLVKLCVGRSPSLYSCQRFLPTLPLPSLNDTMDRYLRTVRPLFDDREYARMEKLAEEFKKSLGKRLQRYLWLKWLLSSNYVSDWWEEYVYLRGRSAIMVNSNFYGLDAVYIRPTTIQSARAANLTCAAFLYRTELDHETIKPLMVQKLVPLCSRQYERQFNTVRIPGLETDKIVHYSDSRHIAVYSKGRWYKVYTFYNNKLLLPCELQVQFNDILKDTTLPSKGEEHLAALTAGERKQWAQARSKYFSTGINRSSLDAIEKAAFIVILDEDEYHLSANMSQQFNDYAHAILHGKAHDRWFDKSFNFIISKNAVFGFNVEHSWADAPVSGHMVEFVLCEDFVRFGYDEHGNTKGTPRFDALKPIKLKWNISNECEQIIEHSLTAATELYRDVDLNVYVQDNYGKGFMKKCKLSPDAYIQMALQLAHYRDSGKFNLTYEASMTRLFREGRTETVRSCSIESTQWVKSMDDSSISNVERIKLLRLACDYHQQQYRDAMSGKGIDRHLFCLYVVSKYLGVDSPFLQQVLSEPWKLSTSQTPTSYDDERLKHLIASNRDVITKYKVDTNEITAAGGGFGPTPHNYEEDYSGRYDERSKTNSGGGFGPVADDGYGVSYIIAGEDLIFFHISSKKSSSATDSHRFGEHIRKAMGDMKSLFDNNKSAVTTVKS